MTIALSLPAETYSQNGSTIKSTRDLLSKPCVKKKARFRWTSGEPAALQLISQKLFMLMSTVKEYNALWLELSRRGYHYDLMRLKSQQVSFTPFKLRAISLIKIDLGSHSCWDIATQHTN